MPERPQSNTDLALRSALEPRPSTPRDLLSQMDVVRASLVDADLAHVEPFASTYLAMTTTEIAALDTPQVNDPETMEALMYDFAGWYFDALSSHVSGDADSVPPAWQKLFNSSPESPEWLLVSLGVNAHIINDLAQSLNQIGANADSFRGDFFAVNRTIQMVSTELAPRFIPRLPIVPRIGQLTVGTWRRWAWSDFKKLSEAQTPEATQQVVNKIEGRAAHCARGLILLGTGLKPAERFLPEPQPA